MGDDERLVITAIHDGFGNQLFQYAAGLGFATRLGARLKLDFSTVAHNPNRPLGLQHLHVQVEAASSAEVARVCGGMGLRVAVARRFGRRPRSRGRCFFETMHYQFDERLWQRESPVYMDGYWQAPRYFAHVRDKLQRDLRIRKPPDSATAELVEQARESCSVGVHVRRGDYLQHPFMHVLEPAYYESAAEAVCARVDKPTFFVVSDDPQWARRSLRLPGDTVWTWELGERGFIEDFRLLRACKHLVIANSSFSWWPAWLSDADSSVVVAPKRWLAKHEVPQLYEEHWILL